MKKWIKKSPPYLFTLGIFGFLKSNNPSTLEGKVAMGMTAIFLITGAIILHLDKPKK